MKHRIIGFDFARALAILGMMLVNYRIVFTMEKVTWSFPARAIALIEGRAAAVFLLLAGIGISLMSRTGLPGKNTDERLKIRITLIKRAMFLFILGMILYVLFEWTADILHYYGVFMVLLSLVLFLKNRGMFLIALVIPSLSLLLQVFLNYENGWTADFMNYMDFFTLRGFFRNLLFNGYHPLFPWISFMLFGIFLGRRDFNDLNQVKRLFVLSLTAALCIEGLSLLLIRVAGGTETAIYFLDTKPMNPTVFYVASSASWGTAFICLCRLLQEYWGNHAVYKGVVQTGQLALTHYILHSVVVLGVFYILDGLAYRNEWFVILLSTGVFVVMVLFSVLWLKRFRRGPFELLMRKLAG